MISWKGRCTGSSRSQMPRRWQCTAQSPVVGLVCGQLSTTTQSATFSLCCTFFVTFHAGVAPFRRCHYSIEVARSATAAINVNHVDEDGSGLMCDREILAPLLTSSWAKICSPSAGQTWTSALAAVQSAALDESLASGESGC